MSFELCPRAKLTDGGTASSEQRPACQSFGLLELTEATPPTPNETSAAVPEEIVTAWTNYIDAFTMTSTAILCCADVVKTYVGKPNLVCRDHVPSVLPFP